MIFDNLFNVFFLFPVGRGGGDGGVQIFPTSFGNGTLPFENPNFDLLGAAASVTSLPGPVTHHIYEGKCQIKRSWGQLFPLVNR